MSGGGTVMDVDGEHSDDDGERDKDHGEHQVLPNKRNSLGGGRDDLLNDQQEDSEWYQHWGAQRDLLTTVGGQVEDKDSEKGKANAGNNEEEGVEKRQPADDEEIGDGGVGGAAVGPHATAARGLHYLPFTIVKIVLLVNVEVLKNDVHLVKNPEKYLSLMKPLNHTQTVECGPTWEPS